MSGAAVFNEEDQMKRKIDRASVIMGILLIFSLTGVKSFAIVMKNRISPMKHKSLFQVAGVRAWILIALAVVLLLLIIIKEKNEMKNAVTGLFASVYAGLMIVSFGVIVQKLTEGRSSGYRVTFGISIYIVMLCCYAIIIKCNENIKKSWVRYVNIFTGMFIICAILYAFMTIMRTRSCGEDTITTPSTGRDWKTVSGTSPVPGGISTKR